MTLTVSCGSESASEPISRAEIAEIARTEVELALQAATSSIPAPTPGISREEAERIVHSAISNIPEPPTEPGLTRAEAESIVEAAVAGIEIPTARLTLTEIEQIAQYAMDNTSMPVPGVTREEAESMVQAAFSSLPTPEPGLTAEDIERTMKDAIAELPQPEAGVNKTEAQLIARAVVGSIPPKTSPAEYTKYFVDSAISRYEVDGLDAMLEYYNSIDSVDGQWYMFILDEEDLVIGHYNDIAIGVDLKGPLGIDAEGYNFGAQMLTATEEGKWVSYVHRNPAVVGTGPDFTVGRELKHAWVVRHDGMLFGSGWYGPPEEQTRYLVRRAIERFHTHGLDATMEYYNRPESADSEWYVFIAERSGNTPVRHDIIAHYDPEYTGTLLEDLLGIEKFEGSREGHWVSYEDINPLTGEMQGKRFWMVEQDGLVFGSGWYYDQDSQ